MEVGTNMEVDGMDPWKTIVLCKQGDFQFHECSSENMQFYEGFPHPCYMRFLFVFCLFTLEVEHPLPQILRTCQATGEEFDSSKGKECEPCTPVQKTNGAVHFWA